MNDTRSPDTGRAGAMSLTTREAVESRRLLTRLFRASPAPFLIVKPDPPRFTIIEANDAYLTVTMRTREEVVGRGIFEAYPDNPDEPAIGGASTLRASLERVLATGQPDTLVDMKYDVARPDGTFEERWWSPINSPVLDENGEIEAIIHNTNDVTAEHRAEAALRRELDDTKLLQRISTALMSDERSLYDTLLDAIVQIMRSDFASFQLFHPERGAGGELELLTSHGLSADVEQAWRWIGVEHGTVCGESLRTGRRTIVADIETCDFIGAEDRHVFHQAGIVAVQSTPLKSRDGTMVGMIGTHWRKRHRPSERDLRLLDIVARQAADLLERNRIEEATRQSDAQLNLAVEIGSIGHWSLDLATGTFTTSAAYRRNFGQVADQPFSYEALVASIHPDDRDRQQQAVRAAIEARSRFDIEYRLTTPEGEPRWAAIRGRYEDGEHPRLVGVSLNVTESKRAEQAMRESEERQAFLLKLSDAVRPLADPAAVAEAACRILVQHLDASRAQFTEVEGEAGAEIGEARGEYVARGQPMLRRYPLGSFGEPLVAMLRAGETLVLSDTGSDSRLTDAQREALAAVESPAAVSIPLVKQGRLIATFTVHDDVPRDWTATEIALVEETAARSWDAFERTRAEAALREKSAQIERGIRIFDTTLSSITDFAYIFDLEGRFRYVNKALLDLWGLPLEQAVGKNFFELPYSHDLAARLQRQIEQVIKTKQVVRDETFYFSPTGAGGYYEYIFSPVYDAQGNVEIVAGSTRDITERKRSEDLWHANEERQAFLLELSDALRIEPDPDTIGMIATRMLAEHMGVDRGYICRLSHEETLAWIDHEYLAPGLISAAGEYHFDDFPEPLRGSEEESMAIDDLHGDTRLSDHDKRTIEAMGMHAVLTGILRKGEQGRVWALVVGDTRPRVWSKADRVVVEEATERTWTAMKRARAEHALSVSETRYRSVVDSAADGIWVADQESGRFAEVNPAACRILGYSHHEYMQLTVRDLIRPKDESRLRGLMDVLERGESATEVWKIRHADGHYIPLELNHTYTPNGFWQGIGRDVSERRRVERELRLRSEQFVTLLRESPMGVYLVDAHMRLRVANPAARESVGGGSHIVGQDFDRAMHKLWSSEFADELVRRVQHTLQTGEPYLASERCEKRSTRNAWYTWHIRRTAIPGDGDGDGVVCYLSDITKQVRARERQKLLLMEINHRVKNTLATVQSVAMQSLHNADTLEEGGAALESRLISLSKAHDVLTREHWEGGDLREVVDNTLSAYPCRAGASRFHVSGENVRLKPKAVVSLSMALHELATNAVKYGALSGEHGYVDISWEITGEAPDRRFHMRWQEHDGPPVHAPERRGFGSRLIERGLAMDMNGEAHLDFDPDGLVCTLVAPLSGMGNGK